MHIGGGLQRIRAGVGHAAPRGDPREHRDRLSPRPQGLRRQGDKRMSFGHDACGVTIRSSRRTRGAGQGRTAAAQHRQGHEDDPRKRRAGSSRRCPIGRRCARPARRSRTTSSRHLDSYLSTVRGGGRAGAARRCTGRATPTRPTRSSPALIQAHGEREVIKVKSMSPTRSGSIEALAEAGIHADRDRPRRADRPAAGDDRPATSWSPRSTRTAPRSARSSCARWTMRHRSSPRPARARRGRAPSPAPQVPDRAKVAVSGANFAVAETGSLLHRRVGGQRAHVRRPCLRR